jgi:hypothetical protein
VNKEQFKLVAGSMRLFGITLFTTFGLPVLTARITGAILPKNGPIPAPWLFEIGFFGLINSGLESAYLS